MSTIDPSHDSPADASREEITSALFANLVMQQTNMTLMLLGKVPHPESGETVREIDGARMFIDQLEMIEFKTRGNLTPQEEKLLKQSLTAVRLAFVEAVEQDTPSAQGGSASGGAKPAESTAPPSPPSTDTAEERRKKFSKSY